MTIRFPYLNLQFDSVPRSFWVLGYEITVFGILLAAGMFLGLLLILIEAKRKQKNPNHYLGAAFMAIIGGFIGARALYVAVYWDLYKDDFMKILRVRDGGMAFYGALFGGMVFVLLYCAVRRLSFMEIADTLTIGLLFGQMVGRFGDFFNRSSFGEYTEIPVAMQLPTSSVITSEVTALMRENTAEAGGVTFYQVAPAFLYEIVPCFILFFVLLGLGRRKKYSGRVFLNYLTWYGIIRFIVEWLRTDKMMIPGTKLDINLIISAALFVLFFMVNTIMRSMAGKREAIRRERQERIYQEEERREAEEDRRDEERARMLEEKAEEFRRDEAIRLQREELRQRADDIRQERSRQEEERRAREAGAGDINAEVRMEDPAGIGEAFISMPEMDLLPPEEPAPDDYKAEAPEESPEEEYSAEAAGESVPEDYEAEAPEESPAEEYSAEVSEESVPEDCEAEAAGESVPEDYEAEAPEESPEEENSVETSEENAAEAAAEPAEENVEDAAEEPMTEENVPEAGTEAEQITEPSGESDEAPGSEDETPGFFTPDDLPHFGKL